MERLREGSRAHGGVAVFLSGVGVCLEGEAEFRRISQGPEARSDAILPCL